MSRDHLAGPLSKSSSKKFDLNKKIKDTIISVKQILEIFSAHPSLLSAQMSGNNQNSTFREKKIAKIMKLLQTSTHPFSLKNKASLLKIAFTPKEF